MKILITGFEPFGGSDINSSWEVAFRLAHQDINSADIRVEQLPVSFSRAGEIIRNLIKVHKADVLIMLGQRGGGKSIDIERISVNMMDASKPDNDGCCPQEQMICPKGNAAYFSNLPVKILRDALLQKNIPAKVSNSAGLYVCNSTYYHALNEIFEQRLKTKAVFVHLPKISNEFSLDFLTESVETIIKMIIDNI